MFLHVAAESLIIWHHVFLTFMSNALPFVFFLGVCFHDEINLPQDNLEKGSSCRPLTRAITSAKRFLYLF